LFKSYIRSAERERERKDKKEIHLVRTF